MSKDKILSEVKNFLAGLALAVVLIVIVSALGGCTKDKPGCTQPNGAGHPVPATCTVPAN